MVDLPAMRPNVIHLCSRITKGPSSPVRRGGINSRTGTIGFIGGMDGPVIWPFEAGYEAGCPRRQPVDQDPGSLPLTVRRLQRVPGSCLAAETAAAAQYGAGADVIFGAAGDLGLGVFRAASDRPRRTDRRLWAIGVDSDQYQTVGDNPANVGWATWQPHILTSMLKRTTRLSTRCCPTTPTAPLTPAA